MDLVSLLLLFSLFALCKALLAGCVRLKGER